MSLRPSGSGERPGRGLVAAVGLAILLASGFAVPGARAFEPAEPDLLDFFGGVAPFPDLDAADESIAAGYEKQARHLADLAERARMFHRDATIAHDRIAALLEPIAGVSHDPSRDVGDVAFLVGEVEKAEARATRAAQSAITARGAAERGADEACDAAGESAAEDARAGEARAARGAGEATEAAREAKDAAEEAGALVTRLEAATAASDGAPPSLEEALQSCAEPSRTIADAVAGIEKIRREADRTVEAMRSTGADLFTPEALESAGRSRDEIARLGDEVGSLSRRAAELERAARSAPPPGPARPDGKKLRGLAASAEYAAGHAATEREAARTASQRAAACAGRAWARAGSDSRRADADSASETDGDFEELFDDIESSAFDGIERADAEQERSGHGNRDRVRVAAGAVARDADAYTRDVESRRRETYDDFRRRLGEEIDVASAERERRRPETGGTLDGATTGGLGGWSTGGIGGPAGGGSVGGATTGGGSTPRGSVASAGSGGARGGGWRLSCTRLAQCEVDRMARQGAKREDLDKVRATVLSACPRQWSQVTFSSRAECVEGCKRNSHPDTHRSCECICS